MKRLTSGWKRVAGLALALVAVGGIATGADFVYPQSGRLTSNFYSSRPYGNHGALDIAGPNGTAITAGRSGTCIFSGWSGGYGNLVIIRHRSGYTSYYAHLSRRDVSSGQAVGRRQRIGLEGSTGNSTGPHVHWEVRRYGSKQFVPGRVGNWVTRYNELPYNYPGLD